MFGDSHSSCPLVASSSSCVNSFAVNGKPWIHCTRHRYCHRLYYQSTLHHHPWDHDRAIYPNVGGYQHKSSLSRRDAVLINKLHIGHTRLKHSYLLSGDDQPVCSACQSPLTVKHFLIECVNFAAIRSRYFSASSMKDVFENVNAQSVIDFKKFSFITNYNLVIYYNL